MRTEQIYRYFAGLLLLLGGILSAQELTLNASVSHNPVAVGQIFRYQLEIQGSSDNLPEVKLPDFSDFRVRSGPNLSTGYQIINGAMSSSRTYSLDLIPLKEGVVKIDAVSVVYKGNAYQSSAINLTVGGKSQAQSGNNSQADASDGSKLFLAAVPSKRTAYVNEPIALRYKLYFSNVSVRNWEPVRDAETVGFWVEEAEQKNDIPLSTEVIKGVQYRVAELKRMTIFPTRAGELTISPKEIAVSVMERSRQRRNPFSFEDFFDSPFGGRTVRRELASRGVDITVKPLPREGQPASFSGLVGSFEFSTSVDRLQVATNEAITYKIKLSGNGNLKSQQDLKITFPPSFEVFAPKINSRVDKSGATIYSTRELEYVLIPRSAGAFTIEPFAFSYFDPAAEKYKTINSQAYTIQVSQGEDISGIGATSFLAKNEVELLGRDINFIKEGALQIMPAGYHAYKASWFWSMLILPMICLSAVYGYRLHLDKLSSNVEYARNRKAFKQASKRLAGARKSLNANKIQEFYAEVSGGLVGYVADKTNRSAAGLLRDDVASLLADRGVDPETSTAYLKHLDEADFRRFAPGEASVDEAEKFYSASESVLVRVGKFL